MGPCRQFAIAHGAQVAAQGLLADRHALFIEQPLHQIDDPPTNHAMRSRDRTLFDDLGQCPFMLSSKHRTRARRLAVKQALGPVDVETQHPIPTDASNTSVNNSESNQTAIGERVLKVHSFLEPGAPRKLLFRKV